MQSIKRRYYRFNDFLWKYGIPAIGASIIAANQETGYTENAIISLNGQYFLNNLPQGKYIVMVAYPDGTNKVVNDFQLESGINHELDFSY